MEPLASFKDVAKMEDEIATEEKPRRRVLRRFVNRGGELVEVEQIVKETR